MQQITVSLGQRSYPIEIGPGLLREARRRLEALPVKRWAVIADENTAITLMGYRQVVRHRILTPAPLVRVQLPQLRVCSSGGRALDF